MIDKNEGEHPEAGLPGGSLLFFRGRMGKKAGL